MAASLVLGGHSFISQLGNDPVPSAKDAEGIVAACLDAGISWFDTTYAPERVALGQALTSLGRRDEAAIIAWNFFHHFGPDDPMHGHEPYREEHLERMLRELNTDRVDLLVVHPVDDQAEQGRQTELAVRWLESGKVRRLGAWLPDESVDASLFSAAFAPYNVTMPAAAADFARYKANGWETFATSPFVRGWELDKRVADTGQSKAEMAAEMLRFSASAPNVDRVIVSMRKVEYVSANLAAIA